jgi:hypothetical protein
MEAIALITPVLALLTLADGNFPPAGALIEKAIAADKAQEAKGLKFTWREDEERRDAKGDPIHPFVKTYDVIMLEGSTYRKLILEDARPLDAKTAKKVEQELEKARAERRSRRSLPFVSKTIHFSGIDDLIRLFDNTVTGEETVGGRKAWRVESSAKAGVRAANATEEELLATRRVTWFDEEDGAEVRHTTNYVRQVHKIEPTTRNEMDRRKVGDAWLPATLLFYNEFKIIPGITGVGQVRYRYYDYKRFTAESTFTPN